MKSRLKAKNWKSTAIIIFALAFVFIAPTLNIPVATIVKAETAQEKLDRLGKELEDLKNQKSQLQSQLDSNTYTINGYNSQVSRLQGEAALYQHDIDQLRIEIEQLETNIEILNGQIAENKKEVKRSEDTIVDLDRESSIRIKNSYMNYRMYGNITGGSTLLVIDDINSYFKDSQYKEIIQSGTNELMIKVAQLKQELSDKKKQLDIQLNQVKRDKEIVDIKKTDLDKKKEDVDVKLAEYYQQVNLLQASTNLQKNQIAGLNSTEQELNAQYILAMQELMRTTISSGTWIHAGTIIGWQGNTGYVIPLPSPGNPNAGTHLHFSVYYNGVAINPCGQLQPGDGCGSDGNPLQTPIKNSNTITQWFSGSHDAIDIVGFPVDNTPVYAVRDGYIQYGLDCWHRDNGYPTNGCANYARMFDNLGSNSGYVIGYWHLKSL